MTTDAPKNQKIGCAGIVVLLFIIGWIAHFAGCDSSLNEGGSAPSRMSKAQWKQKYASNFGPNSIVTLPKFKGVFGEPSSSQTLGDNSYWYYECSDGMIQVVLNNTSLLGDAACVQGINDY